MDLFNRVKIRTPESVELEFALAGIGSRTAAFLCDFLILLLAIFVVSMVRFRIYWAASDWFEDNPSARLWTDAIAFLAVFAIQTGYYVFFETTWKGQTPGKRIAKIRVMQDNGQPVGVAQAAIRSVLGPLETWTFIGVLMIMLGKQEKRIGDWLAGTIVVQEETPVVALDFVVTSEAQELANQILATTEFHKLLPDDFATIREYLQRRKVMDPTAKTTLSLQLARQAKTLIGMQELPYDLTPDLFLEALYVAYQKQD